MNEQVVKKHLTNSMSKALEDLDDVLGTPSYENLSDYGKAAYWATLATVIMGKACKEASIQNEKDGIKAVTANFTRQLNWLMGDGMEEYISYQMDDIVANSEEPSPGEVLH